MIKKIIVKKVTVLLTALACTIIVFSCGGAKDEKNEVEHYPTTDTTRAMEHKNDNMQHDSSGAANRP